ncbi:hypothetical protein L7F22_048083 [Adiantum nelumboides]|nr:hypothetical protein [Adiantum nelumboides]
MGFSVIAVAHVFKMSNDAKPRLCTVEEISEYLKEKPKQKVKRKQARQGIAMANLRNKKVFRFATKTLNLKNYSSYIISEKLFNRLIAREQDPQTPINLANVLHNSVVTQTAKFTKQGCSRQVMYGNIFSLHMCYHTRTINTSLSLKLESLMKNKLRSQACYLIASLVSEC